ncbi:MAG: hypothetical protein IKB20_02850 [Clostridia bacterium]|nr:hypothetical protein [Clostridia bacterium]
MYELKGLDTLIFIRGRNVMIVKKILYAAAKMLGIGMEVEAYFENDTADFEREGESLLQCYNLVEKELALDYFPLNAEDTLFTLTGRVEFSKFAHAPVRILEVKNENGQKLDFELFPAYLKAQAGSLTIVYTYSPEEKGAFDECEYGSSVSETMFMYGTMAQYALLQGMYEEALVWDKKYKKAIENTYTMHSCKRLQSRRWV